MLRACQPNELAFHRLALEARLSGHTFLDRLIADWHAGANRFEAPGEYLLGIFDGEQLVAVGGLNRDPYDSSGQDVGRLRHLYVAQAQRRRGLGAQLVRELIARATAFRRIRLRATPDAAPFYERLGFRPVDEAHASHALAIDATPPGGQSSR